MDALKRFVTKIGLTTLVIGSLATGGIMHGYSTESTYPLGKRLVDWEEKENGVILKFEGGYSFISNDIEQSTLQKGDLYELTFERPEWESVFNDRLIRVRHTKI